MFPPKNIFFMNSFKVYKNRSFNYISRIYFLKYTGLKQQKNNSSRTTAFESLSFNKLV